MHALHGRMAGAALQVTQWSRGPHAAPQSDMPHPGGALQSVTVPGRSVMSCVMKGPVQPKLGCRMPERNLLAHQHPSPCTANGLQGKLSGGCRVI
jgi:hypothetical protein